MKKVAVIQPNFVPWKGNFDIIHAVDIFVFLEDVQYTVRDWRNRNRIKTPDGGTCWLSVPVLGGRNQLISEVKIDYSRDWRRKHLETLRHRYCKAPYFDRYFPGIKEIYHRGCEFLSPFDMALTRLISAWLGIGTDFVSSSELKAQGSEDDRLISLVLAVGGDHYLSGPAAKSYIRPEKFKAAGIGLEYHDPSGYPEYEQVAPPFEHKISVLDLLFMTGPKAPDYIWGKHRKRI